MASPTKSKGELPEDHPIGPVIILVKPQLGENIGAAARAMLNCGITEMRIVDPRDGWPSGSAIASSAGATMILDNAKIYNTVEESIADLEFVLATTARERDMIKRIYSPKTAASEIRLRNSDKKQHCGIMFGLERSGLTNDDVALCDAILNVPLNPKFSSLNLAQAVLLMGYAWYSHDEENLDKVKLHMGNTEPAKKESLDHLINRLDKTLTETGFFNCEDRKPTTIRNIRNLFGRADITEQEIQTLHGIISSLTLKHKKD